MEEVAEWDNLNIILKAIVIVRKTFKVITRISKAQTVEEDPMKQEEEMAFKEEDNKITHQEEDISVEAVRKAHHNKEEVNKLLSNVNYKIFILMMRKSKNCITPKNTKNMTNMDIKDKRSSQWI